MAALSWLHPDVYATVTGDTRGFRHSASHENVDQVFRLVNYPSQQCALWPQCGQRHRVAMGSYCCSQFSQVTVRFANR